MTDISSTSSLPSLDDMLQSLLLTEEGEHEFGANEEEGAQDLRQLFFPVTRTCIYLNHAANGPLPRPVARTLHEYIEDTSLFGNINAARWAEYERGAHRRLAHLIAARPDQIALTASTGDGLMIIAQGLHWQEGDTIITTQCEFPANIYPWLNLHNQGVQVQLVPMRNNRIIAEDIFERITQRTRLVSLGLVEFATGFRNDVTTIAKYCHERGILCGIDAMQALGALDVNVQTLDVDFLATASHKWLLSPQTTGILYLSDRLLPQLHVSRRGWWSVETPFDFFNYEQPLKQGAARFEHSSSNRLPIIGLDAALGVFESIDGGMEAIEARILGLTAHLLQGLQRLGYPVVSPQAPGERSGIICFELPPEHQNRNVEQFVEELASRKIYVAARSNAVRISPHFYNTLEAIDTLLNALEDMKQPALMQE